MPPSPTVYAPAENCGQKLQTACSPKTASFAPVRRRCSPPPWRPGGSRNTQKSSTLTCILFRSLCDRPSAGAECSDNGCKAFGTRGQARAPWHVQTVTIVLTVRLLPSEVPTVPPLDGTLCGGHLAERCSASGHRLHAMYTRTLSGPQETEVRPRAGRKMRRLLRQANTGCQ